MSFSALLWLKSYISFIQFLWVVVYAPEPTSLPYVLIGSCSMCVFFILDYIHELIVSGKIIIISRMYEVTANESTYEVTANERYRKNPIVDEWFDSQVRCTNIVHMMG